MTIKIRSIMKSWLPLAVAITLLCGIIYTVTQQVYRQSANDPQIQMADDAAILLASGSPPELMVLNSNIDMASSLAPYLIIFDESGQPIASNVILDGKTPVPPKGVFDYTRKHKQNRITWQPRPGVRQATVIDYFSGKRSGFVLAGRSMREVENRIGNLTLGVMIGWLFTLVCMLIIVVAMEWVDTAMTHRT